MHSIAPDSASNPVIRQAHHLPSDLDWSESVTPLRDDSGRSAAPCHNDDIPDSTREQTIAKGETSLENAAGMQSDPLTMLPSESEPAGTQALPLRSRPPRDVRALPSLSTFVPDHQHAEGDPSASHDPDDEMAELMTQGPLQSGFPANRELPEDDGMGDLRRRILNIQSADAALPEKARLMHRLLMEGYTRARLTQLPRPMTPLSPTVEATLDEPTAHLGPLESFKFWHGSNTSTPLTAQKFILTEEDLRPTYVPEPGDAGAGQRGRAASLFRGEEEERHLGCAHYRRNIKMQCFTCERWYTCRLCHDEVEDHILPRRNTKYMLCMLCGHPQHASDVCHKCGESAARYYCNICKLWDGAPDKSIYHCNDCGLCRVGEGLGKDFFHCKKCGSCIAINQEESHRCLEGVMDCDCPICGEYMFTSYKKVVTMKCGHTIHDDCRAEYIKRSYKCPICNKSVENMESVFRRLDKHLEEQPMPEEYANTRAIILCNDCEAKTTTKYHWGGLRCEVCLSYNTVELHLLNSPRTHGDTGNEQTDELQNQNAGLGDVSHTKVSDGDQTTSAGRGAQFGLAPNAPIARGAVHSQLVPSPPLSSSPLAGEWLGRSPPRMMFRAVSPRLVSSSATAPVMAMPPPEYGQDGFEPDNDSASDMDDDFLGLWRPHRGSVEPEGDDSAEDDDDESNSDEDEDDEDDYDDDDDDEEEEIALFGHP